MTPTEFRIKSLYLEREIERNKKIRCERVAARHERELAKLKKDYESQETDNPSQ